MPDTSTTGQTDPVSPTKVRGVRVSNDLWETAQGVAADQGEPVAAFINRALRAYITDPNATNAALATIRGAGR